MKSREELQAALESLHARLAQLERAQADREQAVAALRESEERFELAVRGASVGLWDWNVATGGVWWSPRFRELIGYDDDELPASYESWESLLHPDDRERLLKAVGEHFEEGRAYAIEYRMRTKHVGYRWFLGRGVAARDATGKAVRMAGSILDISERKRAHERLTETTERLEHLLKTGPAVIYRCEPRADYPATFISENVKGKLGYEAREFTDDPRFWARHIHPADAPRVFAGLSGLLERGCHTYEYRFLHKDGSYRWMLDELRLTRDAEGNPRDIIGGWIDITERKRTEEALAKTTRKLLKAQRVARMGFLEWNLKTNDMYWSDEIYDLFGIDRQEQEASIDMTMELVHPDDLEFVKHNLDMATGGVKEYDIDHRMLRCGDTVIWVHAQAELTRDADGNPESFLGTVVDITERKRAEEEKEELEARLHQLQKMQVVGQLAGGVAHDFNNVLTVILGNAERLLVRMERGSDEIPTKEVRSGLEDIQLAAERGAALTQQLLTFARKELAEVEVLDLDRLTGNAEEMLRRLLRENIVFHVNVAPGTRRIRADAGQIEQVIMNLILNARDAVPDAGTVTLTCANVDLDEAHAAVHLGAKPGPHVMLAVSDSGVGMSKETTEHIFEPFFTTKPTGKGTGLGLATVYGILQQTGAHISVQSEPGRGSTFTVYFPAVEEKPAEPEVAASVEGSGGDEVILVCEDEELVRRLARRVLRTAGYTVLEAENGKQALALAADYHRPIRLLVSDVIMPEMDGEKLAEEMAKSHPGMRIVFISGYTDDVLDGEVLRSEGKDFLHKPFSPNDLLQRVRALLDRP